MKKKIILYSLSKSLLDTVSMYPFFDISPTQSYSFSLIVSLPLFAFDASPTLSPYIPLSNHYYLSLSISISCSISLLLSVSLLFCYCFSISPSLSLTFVSLVQPLTLRRYSSPSSIPVMIWISLLLFCFCFNNNYFFACLVACLYEDEYFWEIPVFNFSLFFLFFFISSFSIFVSPLHTYFWQIFVFCFSLF